MNKPSEIHNRVFIAGEGEPTYRIACNTLHAGQETVLLTNNQAQALAVIGRSISSDSHLLTLLDEWPSAISCDVAIAITTDQVAAKKKVIQRMAGCVGKETIIAINTDSIPLNELQAGIAQPDRILGLNWCYPADLTFFLEIVANTESDRHAIERLTVMGREAWGKDPYTVHSGFSTRARMMAAWAREAIYLVENGYASMESIDRACRNDAGYYLPFAGNFRYMDLMGTYAYGMVMKDLNPDLTKTTEIPDSFGEALAAYTAADIEVRKATFLHFSQEVRELILKYPHEPLDR